MISKIRTGRERRAVKCRARMRVLKKHVLSVHKSNRYIYARIMAPCGGITLAAASSLESELKESLKSDDNSSNPSFSNQVAASAVGSLIAKRAIASGVSGVSFDRAGYKFHGWVKELADSARGGGLLF